MMMTKLHPNWQPINTAPKNRRFLVYAKAGIIYIPTFSFIDGNKYEDGCEEVKFGGIKDCEWLEDRFYCDGFEFCDKGYLFNEDERIATETRLIGWFDYDQIEVPNG